MIKLGQKVKFNPWHGLHVNGIDASKEVEGIVILINPGHRYFTVSYELGGEHYKMSFNFVDLYGKDRCVRIVQ